MKTRIVPESNYKSIWLPSGKTIRIAIDSNNPITELKHPEFYDIKLTEKCLGKCKWCYQNSNETDKHYENITDKLRRFFGSMEKKDLPYQIAYGGGEPTEHPEFSEAMRITKEEFDICPNYTTNGMWAIDEEKSKKIVETTKNYCGGVAISTHPHLNKYWKSAAKKFVENGVRLNFHVIISDKKSIDRFIKIFNEWKDKVEYFVLLPYGNVGKAAENRKKIAWDYLVKVFPKEDASQIAFGANFYPYLMKGELDIKVSLYEPEIMSKYVDLKDDGYMYASSFSDKILKEKLF